MKNCVLIMAGGTGGHIFPGLAVARALSHQGVEVHWLGTATGLEARLIPEAGFPLHCIQVGGVRGKGLKTLLHAPWILFRAVFQSIRIIRSIKPTVVIGMGGFASGPGGIASLLLRKKLIIHEQNAKAGLTNRCLSVMADKIFEAFPHTFSARFKKRIKTIGNPIREELFSMPEPSSRFTSARAPRTLRWHLLVLGGSLGAVAINDILPGALALLPPDDRPDVYHQTGEKHFGPAQMAYQTLGLSVNIVPFIADMKAAYAWADGVLCRAGASTVSELCAVGLGAILVPYPHAVDDHQTLNAQFMVKLGAALLVQQSALTEEVLANRLQMLSTAYKEMANAAFSLRQVNATTEIVNQCKEYLK